MSETTRVVVLVFSHASKTWQEVGSLSVPSIGRDRIDLTVGDRWAVSWDGPKDRWGRATDDVGARLISAGVVELRQRGSSAWAYAVHVLRRKVRDQLGLSDTLLEEPAEPKRQMAPDTVGPSPVLWRCACGRSGEGEDAAHDHALESGGDAAESSAGHQVFVARVKSTWSYRSIKWGAYLEPLDPAPGGQVRRCPHAYHLSRRRAEMCAKALVETAAASRT